jgi:hypothetical protein
MTYNEVKKTIGDVLESHRMLKTVKMVRPQEWLNRTTDALFPAAFYFVNSGTINKGHDNDFTIAFWFLDKSGQEYKYESDVVSDMLGVATDIINLLNVGNNPYIIDESITYNVATDQYEDYLAGVTFNLNLKTFSTFTACDAPTI